VLRIYRDNRIIELMKNRCDKIHVLTSDVLLKHKSDNRLNDNEIKRIKTQISVFELHACHGIHYYKKRKINKRQRIT